MNHALRAIAIAIAPLAVVVSVSPRAAACGGCFNTAAPTQPASRTVTTVTGHRMALSISTERTVLWDQIEYSGEPEDFAWVLPVRPGAILELSTDAFFDVLTAATSARVSSPPSFCASSGSPVFYRDDGGGCSFGCGDDSEEGSV